MPDEIRHKGLHSLSAMVLGIANMGQKVHIRTLHSEGSGVDIGHALQDLNTEIEDCRIAHQEFQYVFKCALVVFLWT